MTAARCLCITSDGREKCGIDHAESLRRKTMTPPSPRMDMVVRLELEGRDPIEVPIPYQPDDQAPLIATALTFIVSGMPIFTVPFSSHGTMLHTICSRLPGGDDDPSTDVVTAVRR